MKLPDPFAYPMRPHARRHGPQGYSKHGEYRNWLRDEFAFRFPSFASETEGFTFGIKEVGADRYQAILKRRESSDITNIVLALLESLFPSTGFFRKRRPDGLPNLGMKLVALLVSYAQSVEAKLQPYAQEFGVPTDE